MLGMMFFLSRAKFDSRSSASPQHSTAHERLDCTGLTLQELLRSFGVVVEFLRSPRALVVAACGCAGETSVQWHSLGTLEAAAWRPVSFGCGLESLTGAKLQISPSRVTCINCVNCVGVDSVDAYCCSSFMSESM